MSQHEAPLLSPSWVCGVCSREAVLMTRLPNGKLACSKCWRKAGSPWPKN